METEKRKLFLLMNKKASTETGKDILQNFLAFFQLKKWFCKIFRRFSN